MVGVGGGGRRGEGSVARAGGGGVDCRGGGLEVLGVEAMERGEAESVAGHLDWSGGGGREEMRWREARWWMASGLEMTSERAAMAKICFRLGSSDGPKRRGQASGWTVFSRGVTA